MALETFLLFIHYEALILYYINFSIASKAFELHFVTSQIGHMIKISFTLKNVYTVIKANIPTFIVHTHPHKNTYNKTERVILC